MAEALSVEAARAAILAATRPIADTRTVPLEAAVGCVLAAPVVAGLTQPPFAASAMDGYAVRAADVATPPVTLRVVGEAAAGHAFEGTVGPGEAARIFTGAPMPAGADSVVIQENTRRDGSTVTVLEGAVAADHVRPAGGDFRIGDTVLTAGRRIGPREVTLAAATGHAELVVRRPPLVAILATGDELVLPGTAPARDQIVCSNVYGIAAMVRAAGGEVRQLGIARDNAVSLAAHVAAAEDADVLVTVGGASVGDHDLVGPVLTQRGMRLDFWKIAMRPGKPLMHGRLGAQQVLGLPGNPVSSLVCSRIFLVPMLRALQGLPDATETPATAVTSVPLAANGPRAHYMRATLARQPDGSLVATPVRSQDSSLLTPLADADAILIRPVGAPAAPAGSPVPVLPLDF